MDEENQEIKTKPETEIPTLSPRRNEIVNQLAPTEIDDDKGFTRTIYSLRGRRFCFRGKEELPKFPTLSTNVTAIGSAPTHTPQDEYQKYHQELSATPPNEQGPVLCATKDLQGVIELVLAIDGNNPTALEIKNSLSSGIYNQSALEVIDMLIACNFVSENGKWLDTAVAGADAEAIVVDALCGDKKSRLHVQKQVKLMNTLDNKAEVKRLKQLRLWAKEVGVDLEPERYADPYKLVALHRTNFKPDILDENRLAVQTTHTGSGWQILRNSVHVSINTDPAAGIGAGDWSRCTYVVMGNLGEMINTNGLPTNLESGDTWWYLNPNEPLVFANCHLVEPGNPETGLFHTSGNRTLYKNQGYSISDLKLLNETLTATANNPKWGKGEFIGVWQTFDSLRRYSGESEIKEVAKKLYDFLQGEVNQVYTREQDPFSWFYINSQSDSLTETTQTLLDFSGVSKDLSEDAYKKLVARIVNEIEENMMAAINRLAVNDAMRKRGYIPSDDIPSHEGGWDKWCGSVGGSIEDLGYKLKCIYGLHANSPQRLLTSKHYHDLHQAYVDSNFLWERYSPEMWGDLMGMYDPKTRRVAYESGLLTARN